MNRLGTLIAVTVAIIVIALYIRKKGLSMVNVKSTVRFQALTNEMQNAMAVVQRIWAKYGKVPTITSANDSTHMAQSKHYINQALDFRTKDLPKDYKPKMIAEVRAVLGSAYDVIFESEGTANEHMHIEYDPKTT